MQHELVKKSNLCTELEAIQHEQLKEAKLLNYKHEMTLKQLEQHLKKIKEHEQAAMKTAKEMKKMKKLQEMLMNKVVELGGPDVLKKLLKEHEAMFPDSDEDDAKLSPRSRRRKQGLPSNMPSESEFLDVSDPKLRAQMQALGLKATNMKAPNGEQIYKGKDGKFFIKGPNGEMIEVDQNGNPIP